MEDALPRLSPVWEQSLTNILGHGPNIAAGRSLKQWVAYHGVHSLLGVDHLSWDPEEYKSDTSQTIYHLNHHEELLHLRTNQIKQVSGLITYMRHILESYNSGPALSDDPFKPFSYDDWMTNNALHKSIYLVNNIH